MASLARSNGNTWREQRLASEGVAGHNDVEPGGAHVGQQLAAVAGATASSWGGYEDKEADVWMEEEEKKWRKASQSTKG